MVYIYNDRNIRDYAVEFFLSYRFDVWTLNDDYQNHCIMIHEPWTAITWVRELSKL